jgi:hypothetical protein
VDFDVEATEKPINIAYSNVGLGFHQDLVYYESPPGDDVIAQGPQSHDPQSPEEWMAVSFP